jgi:hypothetical protein
VVEIPPCRPDEIEAVLALWDRCRSSHAVTPDSAERVARLVADDPLALLVAELGGALAGSGASSSRRLRSGCAGGERRV